LPPKKLAKNYFFHNNALTLLLYNHPPRGREVSRHKRGKETMKGNSTHKRHAFTLIELLIAIAIIGIFIGIFTTAVPSAAYAPQHYAIANP